MSEPFWGIVPQDKRAETFKSLRVVVDEDSQGWWQKQPFLRRHEYNVHSVPEFIPCCNPNCRNGGLVLWRALHTYGSGKHHISCDGHEGYIRGRQKGPKCDNSFVVFMTFEGARNWRPDEIDTISGKDLTVEVREDYFGLLGPLPGRPPSVMKFQEQRIPEVVRCCNPRCANGGLMLADLVRQRGEGEHDIACGGRDTTTFGSKCDNHWNIIVSRR